jgi:hypothetical protein
MPINKAASSEVEDSTVKARTRFEEYLSALDGSRDLFRNLEKRSSEHSDEIKALKDKQEQIADTISEAVKINGQELKTLTEVGSPGGGFRVKDERNATYSAHHTGETGILIGAINERFREINANFAELTAQMKALKKGLQPPGE